MGTAIIRLIAVDHAQQGRRDAHSRFVKAHVAGRFVRATVVAELQSQRPRPLGRAAPPAAVVLPGPVPPLGP